MEDSVKMRLKLPSGTNNVVEGSASKPLTVEITLENKGIEPIYYLESLPQLDFKVTVIGPDGKAAQKTPEAEGWADMAVSSQKERQLLPAEHRVYKLPIGRLYEMSMPGAYKMVVERYFSMPGGASVCIRSEPFVFEVHDVDKKNKQ